MVNICLLFYNDPSTFIQISEDFVIEMLFHLNILLSYSIFIQVYCLFLIFSTLLNKIKSKFAVYFIQTF